MADINRLCGLNIGIAVVENQLKVDARFEKIDAQIADVLKDMAVRFYKINDKFEKLGIQMTIRLGLMVPSGVSIIASIFKM